MSNLLLPTFVGGGEPYTLESSFLQRLKEYDSSLEAVKEYQSNEIILWAFRKGLKMHEWTVKREEGVLWSELERWILKELPKKDVWKNYQKPCDYEDVLQMKEEEYRDEINKKLKAERREAVLEEVYNIKRKHGI